jgi:hypothetical protein
MKVIARIVQSDLGGNFSNKGISSKFDTVLVIGENDYDLSPKAVRLVEHCGRTIARPVHKPEGALGPMNGGCTIIVPGYENPIPLHDRFETQAQYDALSV